MDTSTAGLMPPQPSMGEYLLASTWKNFNKDIWEKRPALDYVIDFFEDIINNEKPTLDFYIKSYDGEYIRKADIHLHFFNLLCRQNNKTDRNVWNIQNNILRVLKTMRSEEPLFLLPREDRTLTYKFIDRLNRPPRDTDY